MNSFADPLPEPPPAVYRLPIESAAMAHKYGVEESKISGNSGARKMRPSLRSERLWSVPFSKSVRSPCCQKRVSTARQTPRAAIAARESLRIFMKRGLFDSDSQRVAAFDHEIEGETALFDCAF